MKYPYRRHRAWLVVLLGGFARQANKENNNTDHRVH